MAETKKKVKDIMTPKNELTVIDPNTTIGKAWEIINTSGENSILVGNDNKKPERLLQISNIAGLDRQEHVTKILKELEPVQIIDSEDYVDDTIDNLSKYCLTVVLQKDQPVGVLKPADIMKYWRSVI
jgi:CBS domain-containing protein